MKNLLHIIISIICLICLVELCRFDYELLSAKEGISLVRIITMSLAIIGWIDICWEEMRKQRITNWLIRQYNKLKHHS